MSLGGLCTAKSQGVSSVLVHDGAAVRGASTTYVLSDIEHRVHQDLRGEILSNNHGARLSLV